MNQNLRKMNEKYEVIFSREKRVALQCEYRFHLTYYDFF